MAKSWPLVASERDWLTPMGFEILCDFSPSHPGCGALPVNEPNQL